MLFYHNGARDLTSTHPGTFWKPEFGLGRALAVRSAPVMLLWTTPSEFLDAHLLLVSFQDPTGTWQPPFPVPSLFLSPMSRRTHRDKFSRELAFALCMFFTPAHFGIELSILWENQGVFTATTIGARYMSKHEGKEQR